MRSICSSGVRCSQQPPPDEGAQGGLHLGHGSLVDSTGRVEVTLAGADGRSPSASAMPATSSNTPSTTQTWKCTCSFRPDAPALAGEGDKVVVSAVATTGTGKAMREDAVLQVFAICVDAHRKQTGSKKPEPLPVRALPTGFGPSLFARRRQVRAAPMRHFRRHTDGLG